MKKLLVLFTLSVLALNAPAADSSIERGGMPMPFGFGLVPPVQFPGPGENVDVFRLNLLAGDNYDVAFLDIGVIANFVEGNLLGLEIGGICNQIFTSEGALQIAGLANLSKSGFTGIQIAGLINKVDDDMTGFQIGCINMAEYVDGVQIGAVNKGGTVHGAQIGAFNIASELSGIQIGVFNYIENSEVPFMPVINAHF